jgi:hypothetical protein
LTAEQRKTIKKSDQQESKRFPVYEAKPENRLQMNKGIPHGHRRTQQRLSVSLQRRNFIAGANREKPQAVKRSFPIDHQPFRKEARSPVG